MLVAIDARGERLLRIVEMKQTDAADSDCLIELLNRSLVRVAAAQVITGSEDVARVEADADPPSLVDAIDDLSQLLERAADA